MSFEIREGQILSRWIYLHLNFLYRNNTSTSSLIEWFSGRYFGTGIGKLFFPFWLTALLWYNWHSKQFTHIKWTVQWFYYIHRLGNHCQFSAIQEKKLFPLAVTPHSPSSSTWQPPAYILDLSFLGSSYEWNHTVCVTGWSLSMFSRLFHTVASFNTSFLFIAKYSLV